MEGCKSHVILWQCSVPQGPIPGRHDLLLRHVWRANLECVDCECDSAIPDILFNKLFDSMPRNRLRLHTWASISFGPS